MLFMSPKIVEHMTWFHSRDVMDKVMVHPFDGETKKQFNNVHKMYILALKCLMLLLFCI